MRLTRTIAPALALALALAPAAAGEKPDAARKRFRIDMMAKQTLERLLERNEGARRLYRKSAGYAVFDAVKIAFGVSGGGGVGVAVDRKSGERTYMKMGTAGVGFGLGGQRYQVVLFFETPRAFRRFVESGWQADVSASAAAGNKGANAVAAFNEGVAVFRLTEKGLMANADLAGVKFWRSKKLNAR
ncbi:MAG: hypothetical protein D6718_04415 [Acidobacteria bacterium]|nr:MAG: hypothetical protein D6718_04415 [Acidobacteriota bacterium]